MEFDFVGRMPFGTKSYQVIGKGGGADFDCEGGNFFFARLEGTTATGQSDGSLMGYTPLVGTYVAAVPA